MKARVRLSHTVELVVEADSEDQVQDWLSGNTPDKAREVAEWNNRAVDEDYSEEILHYVTEDVFPDVSIKE